MLHEIGGLPRRAMPLQVVRARGNNPLHLAKPHCNQSAVAERSDPDRDIDLVGDGVDALVVDEEIDRDVGISLHE